MVRPKVICIVGPTAVGKSAVADKVAQALQSAVVSMDSMQVYRGMDIGTAKTPQVERACMLHMIDIVDVQTPYSVACFQHDARACIDEMLAAGATPVLCGGTGLYLDAVIDQMSFPKGDTTSEDRKRYERLATEQGEQALHDLLRQKDPQSAEQIHPHNVRRVIRALELADQGLSYAKNHEGLQRRKPYYEARIWALSMDRAMLYKRIDARVDRMFDQGLIDEVASLMQKGLRDSVTACKAIGYKETVHYLDGKASLEETRELIKRNSRRYAKRQLSWIRRDGRAQWLDMQQVGINEAAHIICEDWRLLNCDAHV